MARKRTRDEPRIRQEVKARRELASECRIDSKGDLCARGETDQSRDNAATEEEIRILTDPNAEKFRRRIIEKFRVRDSIPRDVTVPFKRMALLSDSDPDCLNFPEDELENIVRPVMHPSEKAYPCLLMKEARRNREANVKVDERLLYLGDGNIFTMEINTGMDFQDVCLVLG